MNELQQYVQTRSPDEFAALVDRYAGLVYASALRHVGDRDWAQDIAQQVFALLIRKAGTVSQDRPLSAWLLTATRYVAMNERRMRASRRRLEQQVAAMKQLDTPRATSPAEFEGLGPMVDEGLSSLRQHDRDVLMLRFFECRSLREVAAAMGISEDAANKRVARALQRLRAFFQRRGITAADVTPALVVLATSPAAPEALRQALVTLVSQATTTTAAAGGAGYSIFSAAGAGAATMVATKTAGIAAAAVVACAVGAVVYTQSTGAPHANSATTTTPARVAAASAPVRQAATTTPWANPAEQQAILAVRDECFPPEVCKFLLSNQMLLSATLNFQGKRLMSQATSIDRNATTWLGLMTSAIGTEDKTLHLGNTDQTGPAGVVSDTGALVQVVREQRNPGGPGEFRMGAHIDEPWAVGERKSFCVLLQGRPIAARADGTYAVRMSNFPGVDCVQQLVLVVPKGWTLRGGSEAETSTHTIGHFVIYFWQKEVTADEGFRVEVLLERAAGG